MGGGRRKILSDRKGLLVHLFSAINHDNMARAIAHVRSRLDVSRVPCENFQRIDAARMALRLCNGTMSVRLSVPWTAATACGGFLLWARRAGDIDRQRWPPGTAAARRRLAANASSVTLSADVGS